MENWMIATGVALGAIYVGVNLVIGIVWGFKALHNVQERGHQRMLEFFDKQIELEKAKR